MGTERKAKKYCIAYGCLNCNRNDDFQFFRLPNERERCGVWLELLDREDLLTKENFNPCNYYVCSAHFEESSFRKGLKSCSFPIKVPSQSQRSSSKSSPSATLKSNYSKLLTKGQIISNIEQQKVKTETASTGIHTESLDQIVSNIQLQKVKTETASIGIQTESLDQNIMSNIQLQEVKSETASTGIQTESLCQIMSNIPLQKVKTETATIGIQTESLDQIMSNTERQKVKTETISTGIQTESLEKSEIGTQTTQTPRKRKLSKELENSQDKRPRFDLYEK